ncbi:MAG: tRNA (adenosine(37)-N6)-dimethylallyltransferase MiaA [Bacteroidales bacterium]|nr:tRNA (adenosine(37)-N6)-dimethylallyltransferase MiaA [Bacteroidales bacterium]
MTLNSKKTAIVIAGPTAVGKTTLSITLAKRLNAEIISADSRQFFCELKIGTAAPDEKELKSAKHHFIGNLSINDYYNVSKFEIEALSVIDNLFKKSDFVIVTGGSGLYIDAFCHGIDDLPEPEKEVRQALKEELLNSGIESLRLSLKSIDPEYYNIVDLANPKRIMRGIEVYLTTGQKYSELRKKQKKSRPFNIVKIGLNRERNELFQRINDRVDQMMSQGFLEEAKQLFEFRHLNALNTVGYKELFQYISGEITIEKAVENIKTNTRRFAKRQLTWFKKDIEFVWFHPEDFDGIIKFIKESCSVNSIFVGLVSVSLLF